MLPPARGTSDGLPSGAEPADGLTTSAPTEAAGAAPPPAAPDPAITAGDPLPDASVAVTSFNVSGAGAIAAGVASFVSAEAASAPGDAGDDTALPGFNAPS